MDWELGVKGCKGLALVWISNEILLCSTGNLRWSMLMGETRMCTCVCTWVTMLYSSKTIVLGEEQFKTNQTRNPHKYYI